MKAILLAVTTVLAASIFAQQPQQVAPAEPQNPANPELARPAETSLPARPGMVATTDNVSGTTDNVTGTYGDVIVNGDSTFTGTGALLRSKSATRPYVVAQAPLGGGFIVAPAVGQEQFFVRAGDGNVGVGSMDPRARLHVSGSSTPFQINVDSGLLGVRFRDTAGAEGYSNGVLMQMEGNSLIRVSNLKIGSMGESVIRSEGTNNLHLSAPAGRDVVIGDTGAATKLRVQSAGGLYVTGDISAGGTIFAKYQDVAEWVPSAEELPSGTVVILNPRAENEVMASVRAYDTTVAGVVSEQPGLLLGEAAATKEQIATTGRVKVRVDATRAPIQVGDLLVTSDRRGRAMKSVPISVGGTTLHRPGTIVGKALQPLAGGEGEILVLLSLQ